MKKAYISPSTAAYEFCTRGMLALSLVDEGGTGGNDLGETDFGSEGGFEICTNKKDGYWETEW